MKDSPIKILITGDSCPLNRLENQLINTQPSEVLAEFRDIINDVNIAITNLEAPVTNHCQPIAKTGPALKINPLALPFFKAAPFSLFTLANNHILDYGKIGLEGTIDEIKANSIDYVGADLKPVKAKQPFVKEFNNLSIAILNFAENEWSTLPEEEGVLVNGVDPIQNYYQIQECKDAYDKVIVISHGGVEHYPLPTPELKKRLRFFVDAGADAVINHHIHCISGYEEYKEKPIYYSLGNFLFDAHGKVNQQWFEGMAVELSLSKNTVDHRFFTFDQCKETPRLSLHNPRQKAEISQKIEKLNEIIKDDQQLEVTFNQFCEEKRHIYESYLEPHANKYLHYLRKNGLFPSFLKGRKRRLLLNLTRCESHREILHKILLDEDRHT